MAFMALFFDIENPFSICGWLLPLLSPAGMDATQGDWGKSYLDAKRSYKNSSLPLKP
jgi:hypothetical protein